MQQTFNFDEFLQVVAESTVPPLLFVPMLEQRDGKYVPTSAWSGVLEALKQAIFPEIPAAEPNYEFRKKGEMWLVRYEGKEAYLKDSVGARYLSQLFSRPNISIYAVDMQLIVAGHDPATAPPPDAGLELGDETAVRDVEAQSRELLVDLEQARREGDTLCEGEIFAKIAILSEYLRQIKGFGGRLRKEKDGANSSRIAVQRGIKRAIESVEDDLPEFAKHCRKTIRFGYEVVYEPKNNVRWTV